jgi:hypothetical protein
MLPLLYHCPMQQFILWGMCIFLLVGCQQEPAPTPTLIPKPETQSATPFATKTFPPPPPTIRPTQSIVITPSPLPTLTPTPQPTATPHFPQYAGAPLNAGKIGIQVHIHNENQEEILAHLQALGVGWVKVQVSWKLYQPDQNRFDEVRFDELDQFIANANANDIQVMLGVAKAPEWSRPTTEMDGPPTDFALFENFTHLLASRYVGQVGAYELWNETNLQREWNGIPLDPVLLADVIRAGAAGIRAVDPAALIISGAPAPTGINDGVSAVDDRVYFLGMVNAGIPDIVDGMGIHPYGWANPPDSTAQNPDPNVPSHADHPSFFFANTNADYRAILQQAGHENMPLWATEFGWATFSDLNAPPPLGVEYMNNVTAWQQAEYTLRAFELGQAGEIEGAMILWNLNFGPLLGTDFAETGYSLLNPNGQPRLTYFSLQNALR